MGGSTERRAALRQRHEADGIVRMQVFVHETRSNKRGLVAPDHASEAVSFRRKLRLAGLVGAAATVYVRNS